MRTISPIAALFSASVAAACASTPGAKPHDASVANHDAMAVSADQAASAHAAQYDPNARTDVERCHYTLVSGTPMCFTSTVNPTAEHRAEADKYRRIAAEHRAASAALRDAEARACVGLADRDRDMSPFQHREDIASVEPLNGYAGSSRGAAQRLLGATITFRAVPGMTTQWLQRIVDCHIARNAALGHDLPEMGYCPLVPNHVSATVREAQGGFAVAVRSEDIATAQEILKRAQGLVAK
jgi:hypothetical protein